MAGGLVVSVVARWAPEVRGHGIPEAMEAVLAHQSRIGFRTAVAKPSASVVAIGTGAPFGAEGPIIVTGGALGSLLGQAVRVSPAERKILLAAGAAAGMAAVFGAPLGSVLLAIELLLFEFSARSFLPIVVAAVLAAGVHTVLVGTGPLLPVPAHSFVGLRALPLYVVLGLGCGLLGVVITKGLVVAEATFRRLPVGEFWHPPLGAAMVAVIGILVPRAIDVRYGVIGESLGDRLSLGLLVAVSGAKLVAWWLAMGSGTSGSSLAPLLLIGAAGGGLLGTAVQSGLPAAHVSPGAFALVDMAATWGSAAGAPFTAMLLTFEITRDFAVVLPLMLATVVADMVATVAMRDTLMTEKLTRRGITVSSHYQVDLLPTTEVREVMSTEVVTIDAGATVEDARNRLRQGHGPRPCRGRRRSLRGHPHRGRRSTDRSPPNGPCPGDCQWRRGLGVARHHRLRRGAKAPSRRGAAVAGGARWRARRHVHPARRAPGQRAVGRTGVATARMAAVASAPQSRPTG
ncbi:MAG: chloride channel protein [Actinomycetota bacterium]|nr:chloride channel protein [Actinomycetota bacterium]